MFEDIKEVIRSRKLIRTDKTLVKRKRTKYNVQNIT